MGMTVVFYKYTKRPNSTATAPYPPDSWGGVWQRYTNIQLKERCSVQFPVLVMHLSAADSNPIEYNYCYIVEFNRYYFVEDWVNDTYNWEAHLQVDVLATWKSEIGDTTQYILRSSHAGDGNIRDELYPVKAGTHTFTSPASLYPNWNTEGRYIVGIINDDNNATPGNRGCVKYYIFTADGLRVLMNKLFSTNFTNFDANASNMSDSVYKSLFNPIEYIQSCLFVPFEPIEYGNAVTTLDYGYWSLSGISGCYEANLASYKLITGSIPVQKHPQSASRGEYLNLAPYTQYTLFFPPFGQYPIDPMLIQAVDNVYWKITTDLVTGQAYFRLYLDSNRTVLIMQDVAQLGVPIALAQMSRDYMGAAASAVGGIAGSLTSALMGNPIGAIAGGVSAIGNVATSLMPQMQTKGANGSMVSFHGDAYMTCQCYYVVDEDVSQRGMPLCTTGKISNYPGYLLISDPDVAFRTATKAEMDAIRDFMATGFFYE